MATTPAKAAGNKEVVFEWDGKDRNGKQVRGEMRANGENQVKSALRRQGVTPTKIKKRRMGWAQSIKPKEVATFTRQLATMMKAGVPLLQSFDIVGQGNPNPSLSKLINDLRIDIETGSAMSTAFRKYPNQFSTLYCNLVAAGESAGILDSLLDRLATYMEKIEAVKSKIKSALMYPISVVCVALVVMAVVLLAVVPVFQEVFQSLGATLPWPTQMVITVSHALSQFGPVLLVTVLVAVWLRQYGRRRVQWVRRLERWQLGWPWVGELIRSVVVARWTQTLSALLSAGIPLVEALGPVAAACDHSVYARASETMREQVAQGISLNECMANSRLFPSWVVQMCAIGEGTGSVDDMLARAGAMLESEVQDRLAGLSIVLEPAIMVVLGLVIGGILVAMYLPIFQLGQVV